MARVIEIFYTVDGQWHVGVHWMYRPCDTLLAHPVKNPKKKTKEEKEDEEDNEETEGKQGNCEYEVRVMAVRLTALVGFWLARCSRTGWWRVLGRWENGVRGAKGVRLLCLAGLGGM